MGLGASNDEAQDIKKSHSAVACGGCGRRDEGVEEVRVLLKETKKCQRECVLARQEIERLATDILQLRRDFITEVESACNFRRSIHNESGLLSTGLEELQTDQSDLLKIVTSLTQSQLRVEGRVDFLDQAATAALEASRTTRCFKPASCFAILEHASPRRQSTAARLGGVVRNTA